MQTEEAPESRPIWFLIALDGSLVLRLPDTLDIGEGPSGELVLDPEPEQRLLQLQISNRELCFRVLSLDRILRDADQSSVQYLSIEESATLKLNLPHNSLIIAPDFVAGRRVSIDREVDLQRISPPPALALQRLDDPILLSEQPPAEQPSPTQGRQPDPAEAEIPDEAEDSAQVGNPAEVEITEVVNQAEAVGSVETGEQIELPEMAEAAAEELEEEFEEVPVAVEEANSDPAVLETSADAVPTEPTQLPVLPPHVSGPAAQESQPEVAAPSAGWRKPVLILLAAAATVTAIFAPTYLQEKALLPVTPEISSAPEADAKLELATVEVAPLKVAPPEVAPPEAAEPGQVETPDEVRSTDPDEVETPDLPVAAAASLPPPEEEEIVEEAPSQANPLLDAEPAASELAAASTLDPARSAEVEALLVEAQMLYDADSIISPAESNAVKKLIEVLGFDPENQAGLQLMYLCAARLLERAQTAYDAGDYFVARNIVEEILWFHPEFEEARAQLRVWSSREAAQLDGQEEQNG